MESMLERVRTWLREKKGSWRRISEESGVPYKTINNLVHERVKTPTYATVEKLYDTLTKDERS